MSTFPIVGMKSIFLLVQQSVPFDEYMERYVGSLPTICQHSPRHFNPHSHSVKIDIMVSFKDKKTEAPNRWKIFPTMGTNRLVK